MTQIPELERALVAAIARHQPGYRRSRWRGLPALGLAVVLLGAGAGALAATGVLPIGSPVPTPHYRLGALVQVQGVGVVEASTEKLEATTEDPAGGLPWAIRLVKTSHRLGCVQPGRYEDGQIGVIGENGVFNNDARFHPLPLDTLEAACQPLSASGQLIVNEEAGQVPTDGNAIGLPLAGECSQPYTYGGDIHECPPADERYLFYGLLGPEAVRLTYKDGGDAIRSLRPSGPDGAYLIVERAGPDGDTPGAQGSTAGGSIGLLPGPPIVSVTYRTGLRCIYTPYRRETGGCATPPGYTPPAIPHYTHAQLASRVQAHVQHNKQGWSFSVSFTAHAPLTNTLSDYSARLTLSPHGCWTTTNYVGRARPGQRITIHARQLPGAAGRYPGAVYFISNSQGGPLAYISPTSRSVLIGTFTLTVPHHYYRPGSISGCS